MRSHGHAVHAHIKPCAVDESSEALKDAMRSILPQELKEASLGAEAGLAERRKEQQAVQAELQRVQASGA